MCQNACRQRTQVGEVREIAIRPARHTAVDFLVKVQVIDFCRLHSVGRYKSPNKVPKVDEHIPSARIFANLNVARRILSPAVKMKVQ